MNGSARMNHARRAIALFCGFAGLRLSATALAQCSYSWVQLQNPPGWVCSGQAINNLGQVAGVLASLGENHRAFSWSPETGTVQLPLPPGVSDMWATAVNDLGHVVGWIALPTGLAPYLWDGNRYTIIAMPARANWGEAAAVNNQDMVVGFVSNNVAGPVHAFRWRDGLLTDLGSPVDGMYSQASATNELGQIAGYATGLPLLSDRAFVEHTRNVS